MITVILAQDEIDTIFGALDQIESEYGLVVGSYVSWGLDPEGYNTAQRKGCALLEKFRTLAREGA